MKAGWEIRAFDASVEKQKAPTKLLSSSYQEKGLYPIVSQEKDLISGYWDNQEDLFVHRKPVVVFGDHTMVVKYIDFDFVVGADGVKILEPKDFLLPKFFFYWVSSVHIQSRGYARHFRYLREANVPIPSLTEQQRIVDILDQEFAKIDALKANAEKSLKAAKDLFQATLKKELEPKEGWERHKLNDIYDVRDGTHDSPKYHSSGYPLVTSKNLRNGRVDLDNVKLISKQDYDKINERSKVDVGDVLFAMIGTIGNPCLVKDEPNYAIKNMALFKVPQNQSGKLLKYILSSDVVLNEMRGQSKGSNQPFVSLGYLRNYTITLPSVFDEQERIVSILDDLNHRCNNLQDNYQKTLSLCDDLKQALLRKAFNGEL